MIFLFIIDIRHRYTAEISVKFWRPRFKKFWSSLKHVLLCSTPDVVSDSVCPAGKHISLGLVMGRAQKNQSYPGPILSLWSWALACALTGSDFLGPSQKVKPEPGSSPGPSLEFETKPPKNIRLQALAQVHH